MYGLIIVKDNGVILALGLLATVFNVINTKEVIKCCIQKKGSHTATFKYFILGVQKLAKGWNHCSSLRTREILLFSLNQMHKTMSLQLKETEHVPRHSYLPTANSTFVALTHDSASHS